jgi:hypothetical protein
VSLTYPQAVALYHQGLDPTVAMLLALDQENTRLRAEIEALNGTLTAARAVQPSAPSGSVPPYQKPNTARGRRRRPPGRKPGHPGTTRARPEQIDQVHSHPALSCCPLCQDPLPAPSEIRARIIEGLVPQASTATQHDIPRQYCGRCRKLVEPPVVDAMPHDRSASHLRLSAWLHYAASASPPRRAARPRLALSPARSPGLQRLGLYSPPL